MQRRKPDISKLHAAIGYRPATPLDTIIGDWIGEVPLVTPTPIDVTMQRCLAPFQRLGNAGKGNVAACDRSPE